MLQLNKLPFFICGAIIITMHTAQTFPTLNHKLFMKELDKYNISGNKIQQVDIPDSIFSQYDLIGNFYINTDSTHNIKYIYFGRVNACRLGGCSINNNSSTTYENFDYIIFLTKQKSIAHIRIINYNATHGQEITANWWLKQFIHYNGTDTLIVGKNIDAISGATISSNAITLNIQRVVKLLHNIFP